MRKQSSAAVVNKMKKMQKDRLQGQTPLQFGEKYATMMTNIPVCMKGGVPAVHQSISRSFAALFIAVMLLCAVTVAGTLFQQASTAEEITQVSANLEAVSQRLKKQQVEYAQVQEKLPQVQAELALMQPQADEIQAEEKELRQQRKDLRAENAALAEEIAQLQAQVAEADAEAVQTAEAIDRLNDTLAQLQAGMPLAE